MTRRIIQFSTGNVGVHALRAIIERPDLELVGVHAAGADKIGRDAADLCGFERPTGVVATDDIDALLALGADCVVYTSQAETRPQQALSQITRFLRTGTNVVGTSFVWLVAPDQADDWLRRAAGGGVRGGRHDAVRQRGRSRLLRRHPGVHGAESGGPRHRDHRAGDLRLRQLRRRRIHRCEFRFRHHARPHADHALAGRADVDVGRPGAQPGRRPRASNSTRFANATRSG